jgi:hypothetical protein
MKPRDQGREMKDHWIIVRGHTHDSFSRPETLNSDSIFFGNSLWALVSQLWT